MARLIWRRLRRWLRRYAEEILPPPQTALDRLWVRLLLGDRPFDAYAYGVRFIWASFLSGFAHAAWRDFLDGLAPLTRAQVLLLLSGWTWASGEANPSGQSRARLTSSSRRASGGTRQRWIARREAARSVAAKTIPRGWPRRVTRQLR